MVEIRSLPNPVGFLGLGQGVEIKHRGPLRRIAFVTLQGGAAPEAAHVVCVLPEIRDLTADKFRRRDAIFRLGDRQGFLEKLFVARVRRQDRKGFLIFGTDPIHRI